MATKAIQLSPRILAAKANGRKGGLARARNLTSTRKSEIATLGGQATAQYGSHYFSFINSKRKSK